MIKKEEKKKKEIENVKLSIKKKKRIITKVYLLFFK